MPSTVCSQVGPRRHVLLTALIAAAVVTTLAPALDAGRPAHAAIETGGEGVDPAMVEEFRRDPLLFFFDLRARETVIYGQTLLTGGDLGPDERRNVLTALAAVYLSTDRAPQARAACFEILREDPVADLDRPAALPPPVVRLFYSIRDSLLLESPEAVSPDIHTVAVGSIENNSLVRGKWDMDRFARGLTQILMTDLQEATPLRLVDRQRLHVLREEIHLSQNENVTDPAFAVPLGKLCGAQSYLFGSLMQVEGNRVRLDLRWVNTATSEVLLSEGVEMKLNNAGDLFQLERKVLLDLLAPRIQELLAGDLQKGEVKSRLEPYLKAKRKSLDGDTDYLDLLLRTGDAVVAEERGDWAAAGAAWAEVASMQPADVKSRDRARALHAYTELASIEE